MDKIDMKKNSSCPYSKNKLSRRTFLKSATTAIAGLILNPFNKTKNLYAHAHPVKLVDSAQVAVTQAFDYTDSALIKQKVQHLFESLGGIEDVVQEGNKVAIKINITGGSGYADHERLQGVDVRESVWTHPEVLRAVGELIIDGGINAQDIYFVEALWDQESYNNYGYLDIQEDLGVNLVDLNNTQPYDNFIDKSTGDNYFFYSSFKLNQILKDVDVFVSIPKMKQHYDAGVTHSMKNLVGIVPLQHYMMPTMQGYRSAIHFEGGNIRTHLPRSVCDLNMARPVNLAVIDGIKNADGGEGPWNSTFQPAEYNLLLAGKDPVALDSIASLQMGNHPEAEKFQLPNGEECDNYLLLAKQKGMGTNTLSEIELVGDGAHLITSMDQEIADINIPKNIQLFQNYPNPFNPSTKIKFIMHKPSSVSLRIYDIQGKMITNLLEDYLSRGSYEILFNASNLSPGSYLYRIQTGEFVQTKRMLLIK